MENTTEDEKDVTVTMKFTLPYNRDDLDYAMAGLDALLAIDDVLSDLRSAYKYGSGPLMKWRDEDGVDKEACTETLFKVAQHICEVRQARRLPELT